MGSNNEINKPEGELPDRFELSQNPDPSREARLEHARWALETQDEKVISKALNSAKAEGDWEIVDLIESSPEVLSSNRFDQILYESVDFDLGMILARNPEYKFYKLESSLLSRKGAKPIQLECKQHGIFGISLKTLRLATKVDNPKKKYPLCPLCKGFTAASDRLQVNVRLELTHSQKIAELVGFYARKKSFNFLGNDIKINSDFNTTILARALLESSIDRTYLKMQNEKRIDQLAGWIANETAGKHASTKVKEAWLYMRSDPMHHYREDTAEYFDFVDSLQARRIDLYDLSCKEWGTDVACALFDKYWDEAFKTFLITQSMKDESDRSKEIELMLKMMDEMD